MENIFERKDVVGRYAKVRGITPDKVLKQAANVLLQKVHSAFPKNITFDFMEAGVGDGRLAVPLAKFLNKEVSLYGADNSRPMLAVLRKHIKHEKVANIKPVLWDIEKEQSPKNWNNRFHVCILSFLLPHVDNWQKVLDVLSKQVKVGGYLVFIGEESSLIRMRYDYFKGIENDPVCQFWQEYHRLRRNKLSQKGWPTNWGHSEFVYDISKARDYLLEKGFRLVRAKGQRNKLLSWARKTSIRVMLEILRCSDLRMLRWGLDKKERLNLWKAMEIWSKKNNYLSEEYIESLKFNIVLMRKI